MTEQIQHKAERSSNLELYRIIVMLLIVAHHSIVNSGVIGLVEDDLFSLKSTFAYLFGMWGKTGINCFVLITGYFMCSSHITGRKFAKLVLEVLFYNVVIALIFWISGYEPISLRGIAGVFMPIQNMTDGFTGAFLVFFLTIPFLNKLIQNLSQKEHLALVLLTLGIYVLPKYIPLVKISMNYVVWFAVIYFIASYLRLHSDKIYRSESALFWGILTCISILFSLIASAILVRWKNDPWAWTLILSDCNGLMAVVISVCSFLWVKNLNIKQSRVINTFAASSFGVLLIHANSDTMRCWLWQDIVDVRGLFVTNGFAWMIMVAVLCVYLACTLIDVIRIHCVEKPVIKVIDKRFTNSKWW